MKKIIIGLLFVMTGISIFAQKNNKVTHQRPLNSFNFNLLGDASSYSFNYQRIIIVKTNFLVSGKFSIAKNQKFKLCFSKTCPKPESHLTLTNHLTANWGGKRGFFEFGLGGTMVHGYVVYPILGFRFLPQKLYNLNFRIFGEYPLLKVGNPDILFFPIGIEVGFSF